MGETTTLTTRVGLTEGKHSPFENAIRDLPVQVCGVFLDENHRIRPAAFRQTETTLKCKDVERTSQVFPKTTAMHQYRILEAYSSPAPSAVTGKRVAVLFSGGPAAGGHNVIAGLKAVLGPKNTLLGIRRGPKGLIGGAVFEITSENVRHYLNTGGFDLLGTDRTKIKTQEQFDKVKETVLKNKLDGIIIVGGDDSNTNAAFIAEFFEENGIKCSVIGIPKTIDGDMAAGPYLPISFGYDTATKVYSELVGNLTQDAASAVKYYHFVKLMGRTASKITLEVALQTKPAVALISEEIAENNLSLEDIVDYIVRVITERRIAGINHGVILVPEGLVEFIPEISRLIQELNSVLADYETDIRDLPTLKNKQEFIYPRLSPGSAQLMASLPEEIQEMLILERDDHGNVKVSQIETEKLLIDKIRYKISEIKRHTDRYFGTGKGQINATPDQIQGIRNAVFSVQSHFLGYEGRSGKPTAFDASLTFNLGLTAGSLILCGKTAYMAAVTDYDRGGRILAIPVASLIASEMRKGKEEMVIEKSLVKLNSAAFQAFAANRAKWAKQDFFSSPGPIQHWGPISRQIPMVVALEQGYEDFRDFNLGEEHRIKPEEL